MSWFKPLLKSLCEHYLDRATSIELSQTIDLMLEVANQILRQNKASDVLSIVTTTGIDRLLSREIALFSLKKNPWEHTLNELRDLSQNRRSVILFDDRLYYLDPVHPYEITLFQLPQPHLKAYTNLKAKISPDEYLISQTSHDLLEVIINNPLGNTEEQSEEVLTHIYHSVHTSADALLIKLTPHLKKHPEFFENPPEELIKPFINQLIEEIQWAYDLASKKESAMNPSLQKDETLYQNLKKILIKQIKIPNTLLLDLKLLLACKLQGLLIIEKEQGHKPNYAVLFFGLLLNGLLDIPNLAIPLDTFLNLQSKDLPYDFTDSQVLLRLREEALALVENNLSVTPDEKKTLAQFCRNHVDAKSLKEFLLEYKKNHPEDYLTLKAYLLDLPESRLQSQSMFKPSKTSIPLAKQLEEKLAALAKIQEQSNHDEEYSADEDKPLDEVEDKPYKLTGSCP